MKRNKKTVISLIPKAVLLILLLVIINTQLTESVVTGTFEKGLVFSILALGIFISFRILDIPDLSVDGTFTLGVAVSVMQAFNGDPIKGILLSIVAGAIAGSVTGILITKLNVQPILAGIITMTALYSINLKIMDRPNISLYKKDTIFTMATGEIETGADLTLIGSIAVEVMEKSILNAVKNAKQINGIPSYNELNHEILVK